MQYHEYIAIYNARREREQQLVKKYNQETSGMRVENLWMRSLEKHKTGHVNFSEVAGIIISLIIAGSILLLSIWV